MSEMSYLQLGSRACLRTQKTFGFLMLKYICIILETLFLSFLTCTSRPKSFNLYHLRNDWLSEAKFEI